MAFSYKKFNGRFSKYFPSHTESFEKSNTSPIEKSGKISGFFTPRIRPDKDTYYLNIALAVAQRSTCLRSGYGTVIVVDDIPVATGYNGARSGYPNCCDIGQCARKDSLSRSDYHLCPAIHSECSALLRRKSDVTGGSLYVTGFDIQTNIQKTGVSSYPCVNCYRAMRQARISHCYVLGDNGLPFGGNMDFWSFLENV